MKTISRNYVAIFLLSLICFIQCAPNPNNTLRSDNEVLLTIIQDHFGTKKIIPDLINFSVYKKNTVNHSTSTNHFPGGLNSKDSLTLQYDFFDLLLKEEKISKIEYELLNHLELSTNKFPHTLSTDQIKETSKNSIQLSNKGDKIQEYNQYSPVLLFNNKAIIYRNYHNQYGSLPSVEDGTFYLFSKDKSKWNLEYKWTAWIS